MYYTPMEVLNNMDKRFITENNSEVINNVLKITVPSKQNKRHYIGSLSIIDTAGTGGNEILAITIGDKIVWQETFEIGKNKVRQFEIVPIVSGYGEDVVFEVKADNMVSGKLFIVYYTK